ARSSSRPLPAPAKPAPPLSDELRRAYAHLPAPAQTAPSWTIPCPRTERATATAVRPDAEARTDRLATSAAAGGAGVANARVAYQSTSRSSARQEAATRFVPLTRAVTTRRRVGAPGGKTAATPVGVRRPPPLVGTQPMCGRNVGARPAAPEYVPRNSIVRAVVIPGETGLPEVPRKARSIARSESSASVPPTTQPRGHESSYLAATRGVAGPVG